MSIGVRTSNYTIRRVRYFLWTADRNAIDGENLFT